MNEAIIVAIAKQAVGLVQYIKGMIEGSNVSQVTKEAVAAEIAKINKFVDSAEASERARLAAIKPK